MVITGFEALQKVYQNYQETEKWKIVESRAACDVCELLVVLRLQELFREAKKLAIQRNLEWNNIPIIVTAHDYYDLIYKS